MSPCVKLGFCAEISNPIIGPQNTIVQTEIQMLNGLYYIGTAIHFYDTEQSSMEKVGKNITLSMYLHRK